MAGKPKGPRKTILGQKVKRSTRNFKDPKYIAWRKAVFKSCGYTCIVCNSKKKLQAHHVRKWSKYPSLRFVVSSGVCVCSLCHQKMWGKEEQWAPRLMTLALKRKLEMKNGIKP